VAELLREHAATFERALRLAERAERLEREGTPSESARNRAERALREAGAEARALRDTFRSEGGREVDFDHALRRLLPGLDFPDTSRG
jgi:hypothetical protein